MNTTTLTDAQRLSKLAGSQYAKIYSVIKKNLKAIYSTELEVMRMNWGSEKMHLIIRYRVSDTISGKWQFPIQDIGGCSNDDEIQNIFFNLLQISVTTKLAA